MSKIITMDQRDHYLSEVIDELLIEWPKNRTVNLVCHGHSVPAGYFATPLVDTFNAYPHLLHVLIKESYSHAVVNVIVTARGGENAVQGAKRFESDVISRRPDVVTIDYSLNDRNIGLQMARVAWSEMIECAKAHGVKVLLLTPSPDLSGEPEKANERWQALIAHANQVRELAADYHVGLVDSFAAFEKEEARGINLADLMSWVNHPNRSGHQLIANEIMQYFRRA